MATKDTATLSSQEPAGRPVQEQAATVQQESAASTQAKTAGKKQEGNASGIYCYIGPSIRGLIRNGDIYKGTRGSALKAAAAAIEAQPLVKTLIVSGDALPNAYQKVKTPGTALYRNYQRVAGKA